MLRFSFFFSSRRRHTRWPRDWSSDVCSSDLAGFPASSNGDFEAVRAVASVIRESTVCGLCRANDRDIQRGIDALKGARGPWRIHTFIATSALHMEKKLRMTPQQVLEAAKLAVRYAKQACPDVEFSPEDGSRSDPDFLCRVL